MFGIPRTGGREIVVLVNNKIELYASSFRLQGDVVQLGTEIRLFLNIGGETVVIEPLVPVLEIVYHRARAAVEAVEQAVHIAPDLRRAHQDNDRAVMAAYGMDIKTTTESSCVALLLQRYRELTGE